MQFIPRLPYGDLAPGCNSVGMNGKGVLSSCSRNDLEADRVALCFWGWLMGHKMGVCVRCLEGMIKAVEKTVGLKK